MLAHDPAPALREPLGEERERLLDPADVVVRGDRQILRGERLRGHDEQRLERPGELLDGRACDYAQRTFHWLSPSSVSGRVPSWWTLIGVNGPACSIRISPALRSSSSARNATACSMRERPAASCSKSQRRRRRSSARKRSRNWTTGGKRRPMWASETAGGSAASPRRAVASASGCCGAIFGSAR